MVNIGNDWDDILKDEFEKEYYLDLREFLKKEYSTKIIFPSMEDIFNALKLTSYKDTKVVILGQDPYIKLGQAHGLSFSVAMDQSIPPSLKNIYKEIVNDVGGYIPSHGNLDKWTKQGVMLLNNVLTVENRISKSHSNKGWENFTDRVIRELDKKEDVVVFLLWGRDAQKKGELITNPNHKIFMAFHPSPLAGNKFAGCKHFSKTNEVLEKNYGTKIDWQIENM